MAQHSLENQLEDNNEQQSGTTIALPVSAIFVTAIINHELPHGMPAAIAIAGSVITGTATVEALGT